MDAVSKTYVDNRVKITTILVASLTPTQLCNFDSSRVYLSISEDQDNDIHFLPTSDFDTTSIIGSSNGMLGKDTGNGTTFKLTFGEDGPLVNLEWFVYALAGPRLMTIVEIFNQPKQDC